MQAVISALNAAVDILDATTPTAALPSTGHAGAVASHGNNQDSGAQASVTGSTGGNYLQQAVSSEPMVISTYAPRAGKTLQVRHNGPATGRHVNIRG